MLPTILLVSFFVLLGVAGYSYYLYSNLRSENLALIDKTTREFDSRSQQYQMLEIKSKQTQNKLEEQLKEQKLENDKLSQELSSLKERFRDVLDTEQEKQRILRELQIEGEAIEKQNAQLQAMGREVFNLQQEQQKKAQTEIETLNITINQLRKELDPLNEEANLQSFGFYKQRYDFTRSGTYQSTLETIEEQQKQLIKDKTAAVCSIEWTVNGSVVEGRKQTNQTIKLMLRAFNGECDAAIAKVKYNNIKVMEARIQKAWEAINNLAQVQKCTITPSYLDLKLQELYLTHEYQEKLQLEKEEQKRIREQIREEEAAQRELEKALQQAEQEETRYQAALNKATQEMEKVTGEKHDLLVNQIQQLQQKLEEAQTNKERAKSRAQMTRSGHVYVVSNIGSFGENVFKIGMTRRLEPMERINELGGASVPFQFDVHAIIFSEDAPTLENALHRTFDSYRLNKVNERKEFFKITIDDIAKEVYRFNAEIELTRLAEAKEYRQSIALEQSLAAK